MSVHYFFKHENYYELEVILICESMMFVIYDYMINMIGIISRLVLYRN